MPITTGGKSSAVGTTAVSTFSWAHTVGASDTLLVVGVALNSSLSTSPGGGIGSIRLGTTGAGATFTARVVARSTGGIGIAERVELWTLANPTTGLSTLIHVAFVNTSMSHVPLGYGIGFQGTSAVGATVAGASIGTSGLKNATVTVTGASDAAIAIFGKRTGASWTTGGTSSDVLLARSTGSIHAAGIFQSENGTSGQRTVSASALNAAVGIWAAMSLVETTAGGPPVATIVWADSTAVATVTALTTFRKKVAPSVAGSAGVSIPTRFLKAVVPTVAATLTASVPTTFRKTFLPAPTAAGAQSVQTTVRKTEQPTVQAVATVASPATIRKSFVATISAVSEVTARIPGTVQLPTVIDAVATATITLSVNKAMAPTVSAAATASISESNQKAFAPVVTAAGSIVASIASRDALVPSVAAVGAMSAVITIAGAGPPALISVSVAGAGLMDAEFTIQTAISATVEAQAYGGLTLTVLAASVAPSDGGLTLAEVLWNRANRLRSQRLGSRAPSWTPPLSSPLQTNTGLPSVPASEPNRFLEAVSVWRDTLMAELEGGEKAIDSPRKAGEMEQAAARLLDAARRQRAGDVRAEVKERYAIVENAERKAKMAYVRSFKGKKQ